MRRARFAGSFYPATEAACRREISSLMESCRRPPDLPAIPVAGVLPHAGWAYSGAVALAVLKALERARRPRVFVLVGNDHRRACRVPTVFTGGSWESPLGAVPVEETVAARLLRCHPSFRAGTKEHEFEHSIEVQVPLLQVVFGTGISIVPVQVPTLPGAVDAGRALGGELRELVDEVVVLGTTDLTHYGPAYSFEPQGRGRRAEEWVRRVNDASMIHLMETLAAEQIDGESHRSGNACSPGALALTLAAARALGAARGHLVSYATSNDIAPSDSFVGYVGMIF